MATDPSDKLALSLEALAPISATLAFERGRARIWAQIVMGLWQSGFPRISTDFHVWVELDSTNFHEFPRRLFAAGIAPAGDAVAAFSPVATLHSGKLPGVPCLSACFCSFHVGRGSQMQSQSLTQFANAEMPREATDKQ